VVLVVAAAADAVIVAETTIVVSAARIVEDIAAELVVTAWITAAVVRPTLILRELSKPESLSQMALAPLRWQSRVLLSKTA
jgi:hypothetical protein